MQGKGRVLEPGVKSPDTVITGHHDITIHSIAEDGLLRVQYPDGFIKHHQVENIDQLIEQIITVLRRKYGVDQVNITKLPKNIEPGAVIGVKNG